jgi:hypothetical protein
LRARAAEEMEGDSHRPHCDAQHATTGSQDPSANVSMHGHDPMGPGHAAKLTPVAMLHAWEPISCTTRLIADLVSDRDSLRHL